MFSGRLSKRLVITAALTLVIMLLVALAGCSSTTTTSTVPAGTTVTDHHRCNRYYDGHHNSPRQTGQPEYDSGHHHQHSGFRPTGCFGASLRTNKPAIRLKLWPSAPAPL